MILELQDFRVTYGHVKAVKGIDLTMDEGEIVAVIGANGAGKTSTLMGVAGIVDAEGALRFDGADIAACSSVERVKRGLVLCPENRRIFPELSVEENLRMGAFRRGSYAENNGEVYELFPVLQKRRRQAAGYLSGGEQQMLAIGRALMASPRLLLLDEPSLGLAPILVDQVFEVLSTLRERGYSIVLVEQNAMKALKLSDRAYIMETGVIAHSGLSEELVSDDEVRRAYLGV